LVCMGDPRMPGKSCCGLAANLGMRYVDDVKVIKKFIQDYLYIS